MRPSSWFPRPEGPADLVVDETAGPSVDTLLAWLSDPSGDEWVHKVGVVGARDGSAKPTTRLLAVAGHVLKTRLDETAPTPEAHADRLDRLRARAAPWHPDERFFLLRCEGRWRVVSVCPVLRTLRTLESARERLDGFVRALELTRAVSDEHGLGHDPNPSNFGLDAEDRLYYVDDETYAPLGPRELGEALASRLPEEHVPEDTWEALGRRVARVLGLGTTHAWASFQRGLGDYPLVAALEPRRLALRRGLDATLRAGRGAGGAAALTCVLADVHANAPALEAVLAAAAAAHVDSYLVLGDVVGYGPHPERCIARLAELAPAIKLRGNHDHVVATGALDATMNGPAREVAAWTLARLDAEERRWLLAQEVEHLDEGWMAVHGAPRDPHRFFAYVYELTFRDNLAHLRERGIPICFYGHTHVPFVHRLRAEGGGEKLRPVDLQLAPGPTWLVNPGSVGQPRDGDARASFVLWDRRTNQLAFRRVAYPMHETLRDLARHGLPRDLGYRLETGR
jgi:predicted phosphodiesterase